MSADLIIDDVIGRLARRFGKPQQQFKARIVTFGSALTCSINYSKLLHGNKYFFGLPPAIIDAKQDFPRTTLGEFILLICASAEKILVLPRALMLDMMRGVSSRRVDVFLEDKSYILQTTKHPKCDVTGYLNAYPAVEHARPVEADQEGVPQQADRIHLKIQFGLIALGQAEGCSVWIPVNDRNLSYQRQSFSVRTLGRLPNFGFDENTRRIVQNIDVLWLAKNVIRKAFEIESTTSIYSGLLRLNDLVLAQPNIQTDLYVAASKNRRDRVSNQLLRLTFQSLLPRCEFISFEDIERQMKQLETIPVEKGARVSGLVRGEKFHLPDHFVYPDNV
jgi:hypothetical protein